MERRGPSASASLPATGPLGLKAPSPPAPDDRDDSQGVPEAGVIPPKWGRGFLYAAGPQAHGSLLRTSPPPIPLTSIGLYPPPSEMNTGWRRLTPQAHSLPSSRRALPTAWAEDSKQAPRSSLTPRRRPLAITSPSNGRTSRPRGDLKGGGRGVLLSTALGSQPLFPV